MKQLFLGGMRSGKSRLAEQSALNSGLPVTYVATALAGDGEMKQRIEVHQQRRPEHWAVVEAPYGLANSLQQNADDGRCLLVDCLTSWLTNLLCSDDQRLFRTEMDALLEVLPVLRGEIVLVSNESSMGVVPMGELTRLYCDEAGLLHQNVAQLCDRVVLSVAGLPHVLKETVNDG